MFNLLGESIDCFINELIIRVEEFFLRGFDVFGRSLLDLCPAYRIYY